jgi:hypothetical protein
MSLNPTAPARGDRPWWVAAVHVLALLPALMALAAIIAVRTFAKTLRRRRDSLIRSPFKLPQLASSPHRSPFQALTYGGLGALLGYRAGRASTQAAYSQLRLRSGVSEIECRYLAAPASIPVAQGDQLKLWGSLGRDGVLRGYRLENISNGTTHKVTLVRPWAAGAAVLSALLCLIILTNAI